jgi:enediyne biosynthesis protein E5
VEQSVEKLIDPRLFQILFLGCFLTVGVLLRDFSVQGTQIALTFATVIATQAFWLRRLNLRQAGFLSALVSCFGLSILIRADNLWAHPLIAMLAISSKFVWRLDARHIYNPANLGAILAAFVVPGAWVSPGQWGQSITLAAWFLALGTIVTQRSRRIDIGWCFLAFYLGLISLRVLILGQNPLVILHQLQSGALLLFAFFMISDPMTTPVNTAARIGYAFVVALCALVWQFVFFKPNGLIVSLFVLSPLVVWLNRLMPGMAYQWRPKPAVPEGRLEASR